MSHAQSTAFTRGFLDELGKLAAAAPTEFSGGLRPAKKLAASTQRMAVPKSRQGRRSMRASTLLRKENEGTLYKKADKLPGGLGDKLQPSDVPAKQLALGVQHEREHTGRKDLAQEIALDHLAEDPAYYTKLKALEKDAEVRGDAGPSNARQQGELPASIGLLGIGTGLAQGVAAGSLISDAKAKSEYLRQHPENADLLRRVKQQNPDIKFYTSKVPHGAYAVTDSAATAKIDKVVDWVTGLGKRLAPSMAKDLDATRDALRAEYAEKLRHGVHLSPEMSNAAVAGHEAGHMNTAKRLGAFGRAVDLPLGVLRRLSVPGGQMVGFAQGIAGDKEDDLRNMGLVVGGTLLAHTPQLADEAAASIQAYRALRNLGASKDYRGAAGKALLNAFGTYLAGAGGAATSALVPFGLGRGLRGLGGNDASDRPAKALEKASAVKRAYGRSGSSGGKTSMNLGAWEELNNIKTRPGDVPSRDGNEVAAQHKREDGHEFTTTIPAASAMFASDTGSTARQ